MAQTQIERAPEGSAAEPLRWGVLGAANIAIKAVMPAILASRNGRLAAVASRDQARAAAAARLDPQARAYGSYEELLADADIEAVYIPLPNSEHAEWTIRAATAGKHVLCEKPLALTAAEARRIIDACRQSGVLLLEAFMYRFHPQTRWVREQLAAGAIGPVKVVRGTFAFDIRGRPHDIRLQGPLGGGSLMDVGCYPLNYCRMVYGGPPQGVVAYTVVPDGSQVECSVAAVLDFGEGRLGIIDCSFDWPAQQRIEVVGQDGIIEVDVPFTPAMNATAVRITRGDETVEHRLRGVDQYRLQVEHFADCVRANTPLDIPPEDAEENAAGIEMIYRAAGYRWPR